MGSPTFVRIQWLRVSISFRHPSSFRDLFQGSLRGYVDDYPNRQSKNTTKNRFSKETQSPEYHNVEERSALKRQDER